MTLPDDLQKGHRPPRLVSIFFSFFGATGGGTSITSLGNYRVDRAKFRARALPVSRFLPLLAETPGQGAASSGWSSGNVSNGPTPAFSCY